MTLAFTIPSVTVGVRNPKTRRVPHSPNTRMHWGERQRWHDAWAEAAAFETIRVKNAARLFHPVERIVVTVTLYTIQPQDADNAIASLKGIVDGIKNSGIVPDDDRKHVALYTTKDIRVHAKEDERTEVRIDIPDAPP